ncbi:MAG: sporulation integral membrane protein YtvI [Ruminococcaceae bacterium]|nr:sporulation integral membrane protein YtvI [Oscillospiraceae bacterium]
MGGTTMDAIIQKRKAFIINFIYVAIFVGLYYFIINYAFGYIFPFVFAGALSVFLQRPIKAITNKLHIKAHSAVSIILVLLIVVLILGSAAGVLFALGSELKEFFTYMFSSISSLSDLIEAAERFIMDLLMKLPKGIGDALSEYVVDFFDKIGTKSMGIDMSVLSAPISGAWHVVKGIPSLFLAFLVTVVSCVFMTSDYEIIKNMILGFFRVENRDKIINTKRTITKGVSKLFKAYATIMLITFLEMFVGLSFMKLIGVYKGGYIAIIAFVTCIVDIIPVLGTGTVLIPWAVYSFITGNVGLGIGLVVMYAVVTVLRQIIEPKLVANQVGLPAIVTIAAMFLGARLFGAFGIILLPLTVIILKLMYDEGVVGNKALVEQENAKTDLAETGENNGK